MIDEILEDYIEQQKTYLSSIIKVLELDIPELANIFPKSNHDLEEIFKEIQLIEEDESIMEELGEFYLDTLKRGIICSIPLGKTFMAKMHRDDERNFNEFLKKDSSLLVKYVPQIDSIEDLTQYMSDYKDIKDFRELNEEEQISIIIDGILHSFSEFTEENKMMVDYHYREFFKILDIDLKLAKKRCNKRVKLGNKSKIRIISAVFKSKEGKFRVTDLVKEHCKVIFEEGMRIGIRNGIKIVMDDIHSKRIDSNDFSTMDLSQLSDYFYKEVNEEFEKADFD